MSEFNPKGIFNAIKTLIKGSSLTLVYASIYTLGHIVIALIKVICYQ